MKRKLLLAALLATLNLNAATLGAVPKTTEISGDNGGYVADGSAWSSSSIKDKVYVMFYVDPDEKDVNEHYSQALKAEKEAKRLEFQSIAVINLAATWKPNFVIEKILKGKQKEFPDTIYVKDKKSVLVNAWDIADDSSDILIFNKAGTLLFYKAGKMSDADIKKSFQIIKENS